MIGAWFVGFLAVAGGALAVGGCGGTDAGQVATAAGQSAVGMSAANARTPALDPRGNDPTSAAPAATGPATVGTGLSLGNNAAPTAPASTSTSSASTTGAEPVETAPAPPVVAPAKISARHVLIQFMGSDRAGKSVLRTREQALSLAQEVLKRAKAGDDLGRLANEYSDEPNAGARGGSLGRFTRGQMVPAFDQVAFKLRVGQISDIVETPFGFHIIQRTE